MTEKKNRKLLNDDEVEKVAGGNVLYVCNQVDHYCYGAHNPGKKYEFQSRRAVIAFIEANYDYYGENDIFNEMIKAGLITPMQ